MATYTHQSLDPAWQAAQAARLEEYKKQRAAGAFDKATTTEAQRKATLDTVSAKGKALLTNTYTGHTPESRAAMEARQVSLRQPGPTQPLPSVEGQTPPPAGQVGDLDIGSAAPNVLSEGAPIVERDFNREQAALKRNGLDMNSIMSMDPRKLFEMTYTSKELAGIQDYQKILGYENAKGTMEATPKPSNTMLAGLEDALRAKSDPAKQNLGVSDLYKQAGIATEGVSGYTTLMQSLSSQSQIMDDKHKSFINQLSTTAGAMKDTYNAVAEKYQLHLDEYKQVSDTYQMVLKNVMDTEKAMSLLERENELTKEAESWANAHPSYSEQTSRMKLEWDIKKHTMNNPEMGYMMDNAQAGYPKGNTSFRTNNAFGVGTVTGIDGSKYWKHGLDFVLDGGMGAKVRMPISGTVIQADTGHVKGEKNSFGNRVKVKMDDGREVWISHLQDVNVKKGDKINPGMVIGTQGNTGSVYGKTGVHLDITMTKPGGGYHTAREVASYFDALGKMQKAGGVVKGMLGTGRDPVAGLVKTATSAVGLMSQFKTPGKELPLDQKWVETFGKEPTAAERESLREYGQSYMDRVLKAKGQKGEETQAQQSMNVGFITENEEFTKQFRDRTRGMGESELKNIIKTSPTLQEKFGGKLSDYQIDLIYNAVK